MQTCDKRNLKAKASEARCFYCLETASTTPREHSHAQQHNPLPPHVNHQRAPVSSIPPSKSSLPMLLLFRDSNRREQNRSIVQHHHREHDRGRKLHQRHRHGKRNEVLHEAQHPRTSSTSYARTSKPVATRHTVITPVRQSLPSLTAITPVVRQIVQQATAANIAPSAKR